MITAICPVCGEHRALEYALLTPEVIAALDLAGGLSHTVANAGGRYIVLRTGRHIQVHDMCNACDRKTLLKELSKTVL